MFARRHCGGGGDVRLLPARRWARHLRPCISGCHRGAVPDRQLRRIRRALARGRGVPHLFLRPAAPQFPPGRSEGHAGDRRLPCGRDPRHRPDREAAQYRRRGSQARGRSAKRERGAMEGGVRAQPRHVFHGRRQRHGPVGERLRRRATRLHRRRADRAIGAERLLRGGPRVRPEEPRDVRGESRSGQRLGGPQDPQGRHRALGARECQGGAACREPADRPDRLRGHHRTQACRGCAQPRTRRAGAGHARDGDGRADRRDRP